MCSPSGTGFWFPLVDERFVPLCGRTDRFRPEIIFLKKRHGVRKKKKKKTVHNIEERVGVGPLFFSSPVGVIKS